MTLVQLLLSENIRARIEGKTPVEGKVKMAQLVLRGKSFLRP
jgi:hypothetical protein